MKNKSRLDVIFLVLFFLTLGLYWAGFSFCAALDPFDPGELALQRAYQYCLRPLHYFFTGYAAAWLLLVPVLRRRFCLRSWARMAASAVSILMMAGYLAFSFYFWVFFGKHSYGARFLVLSRVWLKIYEDAFFLVLPGIVLCAALRPGLEEGARPEEI